MTIDVDLSYRLPGFALQARFTAERGLIALFGPSGSGKTTLVKLIAGLVRPDSGRLSVDGVTLVDTEKQIFIPVYRRRLGYVFQEGRLFPHLTVKQNLLFGRWFSGVSSTDSDFQRVTNLLGIEHLVERRPIRLSGGEKQRVAIGRALLSSPRLLLLDEPLSSLDEARKQEILPYLERLREEENIPIIYVSHSVSEVARLANTLVILSAGKVVAAGPAGQLMQRLDLISPTGIDDPGALVDGVLVRHDETSGLSVIGSRSGEWHVPLLDLRQGSRVRMRIRARDIMIAKREPEDISALNIIPGVLRGILTSETVADLELDCNGDTLVARLTKESANRLQLRQGDKLFAIIKSVSLDRSMLGGPWHAARPADADASAE